MSVKKYKRNNTNLTISIFYEQNSLNKYNYDPPYQRDYNVWTPEQKSFLIDTILKNFPMPPIFLEQKINDGKTQYDVIDGKQRLNTIIDFINNKVCLPKDFGNDIYGNNDLNGLNFDQIKDAAKSKTDLQEYIDIFWSYVINIEYIEKPDEKIVDNIFDRLNRGGERLNSAELRKAKYYDATLYRGIVEISKWPKISNLVKFLNSNRLEDISFITEIYLLALTRSVNGGVEKDIDAAFVDYIDKVDTDKNIIIVSTVGTIIDIFNEYDLDLDKYSIRGTSHLYALLYVALFLHINNICVDEDINKNLNDFYIELRSEPINEDVLAYSASMQSASKYKSSRRKRIRAILHYLGYKDAGIK